jgi:hypothetical protein
MYIPIITKEDFLNLERESIIYEYNPENSVIKCQYNITPTRITANSIWYNYNISDLKKKESLFIVNEDHNNQMPKYYKMVETKVEPKGGRRRKIRSKKRSAKRRKTKRRM